jgi:hypothetical protein
MIKFPFTPADAGKNRYELSSLWWLLVPIAFFIVRYAVYLFTHKTEGLNSWFRGELGIIENLTVLLLLMAMLSTFYLLYRYGKLLHLAPRLFLVIYGLGCLYFLGEEASWGQHWVGWETGEYFQAANDQGETNFHNTSKFLDRVPKGIVSLAIFLGGVAFPLYLRRKKLKIDIRKPFWWLFPTWICLPTATYVTVSTWPSKIERHYDVDVHYYFGQVQEMKELYIAYFFLLFIVSLYRRLQQYQASATWFSPS